MADTATLTVRRILALHVALNSLDAVRSGKDEIISLEFTGATRSKLMANAVACEMVKAAHDMADRALAKQHGVFVGMPETAEYGLKNDAYRRAVEEALDEERNIELVTIKLEALLNRPGDGKAVKLNPVPQSIINRLAPILETEDDR